MKTKVLLILFVFCAAALWAQTQPAAKDAPAKPDTKQSAKAPDKEAAAGGCCCCQGMAKGAAAGKGMMCMRGAKGAKTGCCCCGMHKMSAAAGENAVTDPVCGMSVDPASAAAKLEHGGKTYYFCNPGCAEKFKADPAKYMSAEKAPAAPGN